MAITRKQHYIPRSILKHFSSDEQYVYECQLKHPKKTYKTNLNNAMCARNIYEHKMLKPNVIENYFANSIDANLSVFEREVISLLDTLKVQDVKSCFARYSDSIIRCYYRSGAMLEEYNTAYRSQKGEIILHILADTPNSYLRGLCHTILDNYHFAIIKSDSMGFIIGDSYLTTIALGIKSQFANASNRQIGFKDTMIILPVSTKYCLVFFHGEIPSYIKEDRINILSDSECLEINLAIYHSSYNKVLSSSDEIFPFINELSFANNLNTGPVTTVTSYNNGKNDGHVVKREAFFYQRDYQVMEKIQKLNFDPTDLAKGRNDLCYCGSGKKHKKCCLEKTEILKDVIRSFSDANFSDKVRIAPQAVIEQAIRIPRAEYRDLLNAFDTIKK